MDLSTRFVPETGDFRGVSLCAGYAGLDLGLHIAEPRYRTVAFVEREAHAAATLVARMEDQALGQALVWDDLRSFDGKPWRGRVHLVTAGYPCQPFSLAGNRLGSADPRHLWPDIARIVDEIAPQWIFCENVEGHLSLGFADVVESLRGLGYATKAGLFTAREAGASHRRRRLFLLAHAHGERRGLFPRFVDPRGEGATSITERDRKDELRPIFALERGADLDGAMDGLEDARVDALDGEAPIYAPGPAELHRWERLLSERPDLQPALLRTGDGMADRLDRIRGAGNGVSSLAAALAWAVLKSAFDIPTGTDALT